jgi:hypothetical protein
MFRKLTFVLCAISLTLASASCGRQVTPNRQGTSGSGPQPGFIMIKFTTTQAMDFVHTWYVIAFNTQGAVNGTNGMPYPGRIQGNAWTNFSFEIIVNQLPGQTSPQAALIQFVPQSGTGGGTIKQPSQPFTLAPQLLQLTPNCNSQGTQFCVLINRNVFAGLGSTTPPPSSSPSPSPSTSPSASPSASASPTPTASPITLTGTWYINWFTVAPSNNQGTGGAVIDAPGPQGVNDLQWTPTGSPYNTATTFDSPWQAVPPPGWPQVDTNTYPGSQIQGGEVLNSP